MTLEEFLFGERESSKHYSLEFDPTGTKTYEVEHISDRFLSTVNVDWLISKLSMFNEQTKDLRQKPRRSLYSEFYIPKKSGGLRRIDAPEPELMTALSVLKTIFEQDFRALYHTSAFAYVKGRGTVDCMKKHQKNDSRWYGKYDLSNFFGSTTPEFVLHMFSMIFPFSEVLKNERGREEFKKAIDLAFLNGGLPQGTPISPLITNVMMIPVDFELTRRLRNFNDQAFVYTRYADDFQVSSKYTFSFRQVENLIAEVLRGFGAPFQIKSSKTRYGSSAGSNWNLGVMINKDNELTVGYKKKKQFRAMLSSYIMDHRNGVLWDRHDIQVMEGHRSYYKMVEGEAIDRIVDHINQKFGVNVVSMIKQDLAM